jgi:hypothetical protein
MGQASGSAYFFWFSPPNSSRMVASITWSERLSKLENNVLTVKTVKGNVDVRLNEKTEITRNDRKAEAVDLKPGTRVVVDVPEGVKEKIAHSVKISVSDSHAHGAQK